MISEASTVRGSVEYLYADIRATQLLNTQAVMLAVVESKNLTEPWSWTSATWVGTPGKFRTARILLDGTLERGLYDVYAKITDEPEAPIIRVGRLVVT